MDSVSHIKACKEMMQESAQKIGLTVKLEEHKQEKTDGTFLNGIEILLRDKEGYLIYKSYDNVSVILGFIDGIKSAYKNMT